MENRRRPTEKRTRKRAAIRFGDSRDRLSFMGFTTDLSNGGMCVTARTVHPPGTRLEIELKLTDDQVCHATGVVAWHKRALARANLPGTMGIRFESCDSPLKHFLRFLAEEQGDDEAPATIVPPPPPGVSFEVKARVADDDPEAEPETVPAAAKTRAPLTRAPPRLSRPPRTIIPDAPSLTLIPEPPEAPRLEGGLSAIADAIDEELDDPIGSGLLIPLDDEGHSSSRPPKSHSSISRASEAVSSACRLIAVTGGASAGKAEVLEGLQKRFQEKLVVLPEDSDTTFREVRDAEAQAVRSGRFLVALCPRSTIDCVLDWTGEESVFWEAAETTRDEQHRRYDAVIHLRPPGANDGGTREAMQAQRALEQLWAGHHRKYVVDWDKDFRRRLSAIASFVSTRIPVKGEQSASAEAGPATIAPKTVIDISRKAGAGKTIAPLIQRDRAPRLAGKFRVKYGTTRPLDRAGMTINLSRTGMAVGCDYPLPRGETLLFVLNAPGGEQIAGTGTVVWTRQRPGESGLVMGIRFLRIHESYLRLLEALTLAT